MIKAPQRPSIWWKNINKWGIFNDSGPRDTQPVKDTATAVKNVFRKADIYCAIRGEVIIIISTKRNTFFPILQNLSLNAWENLL